MNGNENKNKVAHKSGATSSHFATPLHYLRLTFLQRVARRFGLGAQYHGRGNWLRAYANGTVDIQFMRDRFDHAHEHFIRIGTEGTASDDHIGAVGWFLNVADEAESMGLNWANIMAIVTPEEEEELRRRILAHYKGKGKRKVKVK